MAESFEMQAYNVQQAANIQAANVQVPNVQAPNVQPANVQDANLDTFHVDLKIDSESKYYGYTQYGFTRNDVFFSVLRRCLKVSCNLVVT